MLHTDELEGKVAIVTGGGTGIGAEVARTLASSGADVVLAARKPERLEAVAAELRETGRRSLAVPTDVRDDAQCAALVDRTLSELGRIDIVVNNAGGSYLFPIEDIPLDKWDSNFALNVRAAFVLTQLAGTHMLARGSGSFVNMSSYVARTDMAGTVAYASAKAALETMTRVVALEWGRRGIRANAIAVGPIASEGALRAWERAGLLDELLPRSGTPLDIANAVLFLVSESSKYLNGQTITLTGNP